MVSIEHQYMEIVRNILNYGKFVYNERTKKRCLVMPNLVLRYAEDSVPLLNSRRTFIKSAFAEIIGYHAGDISAADFRSRGTKTWDANANENQAWLNNPFRTGTDDMGVVYGAIGRCYAESRDTSGMNQEQYDYLISRGWEYDPYYEDQLTLYIDQFKEVFNNIKNGIDNRGEIITFWKPTEFDFGCLRPCMHTHQFTLVNDTLYLTSIQRSCDVPLGLVFNMAQVWCMLKLWCMATGHKFGGALHTISNAHIYEDQVPAMRELLKRWDKIGHTPSKAKIIINPHNKPLEEFSDLCALTADDIMVEGYYPNKEPLIIPFSV